MNKWRLIKIPIRYCPRCNQPYLISNTSCDFVHECNSGVQALDEEDVFVIGKWSDYTGSGGPVLTNWAGANNELQGTRAGNEGQTTDKKTARGHDNSVFRSRKHFEFIDLDKN